MKHLKQKHMNSYELHLFQVISSILAGKISSRPSLEPVWRCGEVLTCLVAPAKSGSRDAKGHSQQQHLRWAFRGPHTSENVHLDLKSIQILVPNGPNPAKKRRF